MHFSHKVRVQTPLGPEVVQLVALVVQSTVGEQSKDGADTSLGTHMMMEGADTVLDEADKLLEEEGLVSSPVPSQLRDPVEIQSEHEEPLVSASFVAQAKGFLTQLRAMEHSTLELLRPAQSYDLEGVLATAAALA